MEYQGRYIIVTHSLITQTLLSHTGLPTFETLSLNPNSQSHQPKRTGLKSQNHASGEGMVKFPFVATIIRVPSFPFHGW